NTMIVYTSDHGDLMGDHRLTCKGPSPFNGVLQVPLLWKVPGLTKRGGKADSIVTSIDIPKTILNLLNIKQKAQPPDMQGVDLTPALKDPEKKVRDCCLIEEDEILFRSPIRVRHLVTDNYKLTLYSELEICLTVKMTLMN
ncbi:MAG: sulfatase/phosphatase domain-containing protein, partial [Promethearchaeota archaeon]